MTTENLERAFASTRQVLAGVRPEHLDGSTPCASWDVRKLIGHIVGGAHWFAASTEAGASPDTDAAGEDIAGGDFLASFDQGSKNAVAAFGAPGAQEKIVKLPFGDLPGAVFMGLATTDTFTHGWDLARATGQSTDLDPELATALLAQARQMVPDQFRGDDGVAPFGPAQEAPAGATAADQLAAFLGRKI
jgi:uncharacterized protein (TIGR03086 family)